MSGFNVWWDKQILTDICTFWYVTCKDQLKTMDFIAKRNASVIWLNHGCVKSRKYDVRGKMAIYRNVILLWAKCKKLFDLAHCLPKCDNELHEHMCIKLLGFFSHVPRITQPKSWFLGQKMCSVTCIQTDEQTHMKLNTEDTLSDFQEFFL